MSEETNVELKDIKGYGHISGNRTVKYICLSQKDEEYIELVNIADLFWDESKDIEERKELSKQYYVRWFRNGSIMYSGILLNEVYEDRQNWKFVYPGKANGDYDRQYLPLEYLPLPGKGYTAKPEYADVAKLVFEQIDNYNSVDITKIPQFQDKTFSELSN